MTPIYPAESVLDAQLVQDLLAGAGIAAHVVAAGTDVQVVVEDGEAALAKVMIQEWQTAPDDAESFDIVDGLTLGEDA